MVLNHQTMVEAAIPVINTITSKIGMTIVPTTLTTGSLTPEYKTLIRSTQKSNTFCQLSMAMTIKHQNT
jgi:hypothetical protein